MKKTVFLPVFAVLAGLAILFLSTGTVFAQVATSSAGLDSEVIFGMLNSHRKKLNLPAFKKDDILCNVAKSRAPQVYNEIYLTHTMHAGLFSREIPYLLRENIISYHSEEGAINWWLHSPVHRSAIEGNYEYSCGACFEYSCAELFTNFVPKYSSSSAF